MIWAGLRLLDLPDGEQAEAKRFLLAGAELLEHVYTGHTRFQHREQRSLFLALAGYYLSGHHARAMVLAREKLERDFLSPDLRGLYFIFVHQFQNAINEATSVLGNPEFRDAAIAEALESNLLSEREVLSRTFHRVFHGCLYNLAMHPRTGLDSKLDADLVRIGSAIGLARLEGFVDWWVLFVLLEKLIGEYRQSAVRTHLKPLLVENKTLVEQYIQNLRSLGSVVTLWPSQQQAVQQVLFEKNKSFCVSMPTSAGKSRVAELAILRFLVDHADNPNARCLYLVPLRALASEAEFNLRRAFRFIEHAKISGLYGSFGMTATDRVALTQARILVMTPEKADALLRFMPETASEIQLLILDEGHMVASDLRGMRFELLVQRILHRLSTSGRTLMISAVMPNVSDLAIWITQDATNVIETDWRPSRQVFGEIVWNGTHTSLDFNLNPEGKIDPLERFLEPFDPALLPGIGRRTPAPKNFNEALADAALHLSLEGTTLIYCSQKGFVNALGKVFLEIQKLRQIQNPKKYDRLTNRSRDALNVVIEKAGSLLGAKHLVVQLLAYGIVIHHADIPQALRPSLEELIRRRWAHIVIATTTIAEGVNLPFKTVIFQSPVKYQDAEIIDPLDPSTFWNICGRAGRGGMYTEGRIYFAVNNFNPLKRAPILKLLRERLVASRTTFRVESALYTFLGNLAQAWKIKYPKSLISELVVELAERDLTELFLEERHALLRDHLVALDTSLLAWIEESGWTEVSMPDLLQDWIRQTLATHQAASGVQQHLDQELFVALLTARTNRVQQRAGANRALFYKLGMRLDDCEHLTARLEELIDLYQQAVEYRSWTESQRLDFIRSLMFEVLQLKGLKAKKKQLETFTSLGPVLPDLLDRWLCGATLDQIAAVEDTVSPDALTLFLEEFFQRTLPWGLNSLNAYMDHVADQHGLEITPTIWSLPSMVRNGIHDPVAEILLSSGFPEDQRELAIQLGMSYRGEIDPVSTVQVWFLRLNETVLASLGFTTENSQTILEIRRKMNAESREDASEEFQMVFTVTSQAGQDLNPGDPVRVIIETSDEGLFAVAYDLNRSEPFGKCHLEQVLLETEYIVHIEQITKVANQFKMAISIPLGSTEVS